jgi:hypothetical protein
MEGGRGWALHLVGHVVAAVAEDGAHVGQRTVGAHRRHLPVHLGLPPGHQPVRQLLEPRRVAMMGRALRGRRTAGFSFRVGGSPRRTLGELALSLWLVHHDSSTPRVPVTTPYESYITPMSKASFRTLTQPVWAYWLGGGGSAAIDHLAAAKL